MESFKVYLAFPEKWFCIRRPNLALLSLERIFNHSDDLNFWQTSKQIYRKLQCREKVLYSSTKFVIIKAWAKSPWLRRFDLGFSQTSKEIYGKLQYTEKGFGNFHHLPRFLPRKNGFMFVKKILHFWAFYQRSIAQKIRFRLLADFRTSL